MDFSTGCAHGLRSALQSGGGIDIVAAVSAVIYTFSLILMRLHLIILWLAVPLGPILGQNMVPNASFEEHVDCPDSPGQLDRSTGWLKFRWTPDYFNSCSANDYCDVPNNAFGFQEPSEGLAYAGCVTYVQTDLNFREYMGAELSHALTPGQPAYISFKVSPGGWGWYTAQRFKFTTDRIGAFFTTTVWSGTTGIIPNVSMAYRATPLLDTLNWATVTGSFVPDSAYAYVVIGNFFDDALTTVVVQDPSAPYLGAYAFIDDLCVSQSSEDCSLVTGASEFAEQLIVAWPNPFSDVVRLSLLDGERGPIQFEVYDQTGRLCWVASTSLRDASFEADLGNLAGGTYMLTGNAQGHRIKPVHLTRIP